MIAVTGATGQLGGLIIENLLRQGTSGSEIAAVVRTPEKATGLAHTGVQIKQGDYDNPDSLVSALEGTETLMFISNTDVANRERQHNSVVNAARQADVRWIVYTSLVDMGIDNPLLDSHQKTERSIKGSGLDWTFLRDNMYMDAYVVEVEIAMETGAYRTPTANDVGAAMVSRADVARAAAAVLTSDGHTGEIYNMTGPAPVTPQTFAKAATELSGKDVVHQQIAWDELMADYLGRGMTEEYAEMSIMLEQMIASNTMASVSDDIHRLTGTPSTNFVDFVKEKLFAEAAGS